LAVQVRRGDDCGYLSGINDPEAWDMSLAERSFVQALEGGCSAPCAAFAQIQGEKLELAGLHVDASGALRRATIAGCRTAAVDLGRRLADRLRRGG
jgi:hydroxymethylbilane synthase